MSMLSIIILILMAILFTFIFALFSYLFQYLKKKTINIQQSEKNEDIQYIDVFAKEIKSLQDQLSIQERLAVLGEVSAGIAHELRNPLAVIYGNAKLICKYGDNEDVIELAKGIIKEIEEINGIINELLKFAHDTEINKKYFNITNMIKEVIQALPYKDKIEFSFIQSIEAYGDEQLLKQAIKNLIKNANEAGDKIWITVDEIFVDGQKNVLIVVKDNGQGIDEDEINKIFQPFYSTKRQGLGMGLTLVQKIALQHNGFVKVESEKGKGSSFKMIIGK
ncbi:MAG: ATP-binding protein [Thermodesulfovibrionales bacterium]|nr:ATP-binding protein [Thermodesulfovibrionales bacterium]